MVCILHSSVQFPAEGNIHFLTHQHYCLLKNILISLQSTVEVMIFSSALILVQAGRADGGLASKGRAWWWQAPLLWSHEHGATAQRRVHEGECDVSVCTYGGVFS